MCVVAGKVGKGRGKGRQAGVVAEAGPRCAPPAGRQCGQVCKGKGRILSVS